MVKETTAATVMSEKESSGLVGCRCDYYSEDSQEQMTRMMA